MTHIEDILLWAISRKGIEYVYGAEADGKPDPRKIDCSELVQWACQQAGMRSVPDGAIWQYKWCERAHSLISVEQALKTRGALMFPYPNVHHVVFSLGDGTTMEAKGAAYGVGIFSAKGRFQRAALIPGVDYSPRKPLPPKEPEVTDAEIEKIAQRVFEKVSGDPLFGKRFTLLALAQWNAELEKQHQQ